MSKSKLKDIHANPSAYSHIERGAAMMNMMIDRGDLPSGWKVDVPLRRDIHSCDPIVFGIPQIDLHQCKMLEALMIGMAIASGTITLGKCREWLGVAGFTQPHELSMFGMNVRDLFSIDEDDKKE